MSSDVPIPLWSILPFILTLVLIAIVPFAFANWWEKNSNKLILSLVMSVPVLVLLVPAGLALLTESLIDYLSFMVLLGALFIISGGIYIKGEFAGTPAGNTAFLAVGAVLANLIGTTGASMLLIRPYIRANHRRRHHAHLGVFFIFIVSNIGGLLTPLGDPPLFLGFLRGVPFGWTLSLLPVWLMAIVPLLIVFNRFDQYVFVREDIETPGSLAEDVQPRRSIEIQCGLNPILLLGVMLSAILSGYFGWPRGVQELMMVILALMSWFTTPPTIYKANNFSFHPIAEIAAIFLGIFITMIPALELLRSHATELGLDAPWQYFWMTGGLSSFLDNVPTYLTFTAVASGLLGSSPESLTGLLQSERGAALLRAISVGAVFMGANTYIGNGPNFMVKSIAESNGVKMPSFGGYLLYSGAILIPLFLLLTIIFFRG